MPLNHGGHREHGETADRQPLKDCPEELISQVLAAAIEVHKELGPGLLESAYEAALAVELSARGISVRRQVEVPMWYKRNEIGVGFRADLIVEDCLILELKCVETLLPIHLAQIITYLKLPGFKRGYLLNFHSPLMKDGIKRVSI